ncbi:hypothetical protein JAAARDRAFT_572733 [Jaapia argillacea MUCL 33604]|uniref:Uncharacterized protein n=1 Tax=Jaapia argillacea MUCL 33604 TaxID=933084 RepID=A0A067QER4_9AGAM|nr:hypothetical protein JAAARDRAFT_572733 [Jaapia argillacea MUCL 33604]
MIRSQLGCVSPLRNGGPANLLSSALLLAVFTHRLHRYAADRLSTVFIIEPNFESLVSPFLWACTLKGVNYSPVIVLLNS